MAAVLDVFVPYVKKLVMDKLEEEVHMLLGVRSKIKKVEDNLENYKDVLADAERRRITDRSVQSFVRKVKNAMYESTDIVDLCQLEADRRMKSNNGRSTERMLPAGCCSSLHFCLQNPMYSYKMSRRIKKLEQHLDEAHEFRFNFNINLSSYQDQTMPARAKHYYSNNRTMSEFVESAIVGEKIKRETKDLVQVLLFSDDNHNLKVVSIEGMGGMGKTTLARKIFKDATIGEHFKTRIWLSINQHFDKAELLKSAIEQTGRGRPKERDKSILVLTLTNALSEGKFLLVMDDVWSEKAWSEVLHVPISNASHKQPGSRVLVTTRFEDLPKKMGSFLHQHRVSLLDAEDAWSLLKRQLPPNQAVDIDALKDVGMRIINVCGCLPLAIKVIGGQLSTRHPSEREWTAVLNSLSWSVAGLPHRQQHDNNNWLSLTYEDLSPQLQQCLLYCSLFAKGFIVRDEVTRMWVSEGFIQPPDGSSSSTSSPLDDDDRLEELASDCYKELLKRNLLQPAPRYSSTGYKSGMHDVLRSFSECLAREESLVVKDDEQATSVSGDCPIRRLYLGPAVSPAVHWAVLQEHRSLRTLIITSRINIEPGDSLSSFPSLRVLYIQRADNCDTLVDSLHQLKHLRYLHLEDTDVSRLPDRIDKMKFLRYIALLRCKKLCHLPNNIVKLVHLRSLDLRWSKVRAVPKGFGALTSLRALYGFPVHADMDGSWCSLEELAPLSQLRDLTLDGLDNVPASLMADKAMIGSKEHLSYLVFNCRTSGQQATGGLGSEVELQQKQSVIEEVLEKMCPPSCLENLTVGSGGYIGRQLPSWMQASEAVAFKSLRYVTMHDLHHCTQLPDGLCRLPSLEMLTITEAPAIKRIGPEFQASTPLAAGGFAATSAPFPKLKSLQLGGLRAWEEWEWNDCEHNDVSDGEPRNDAHWGHSFGYSSVITNLKETFSSLTSMYSGSSSSMVLGSHDPDDCTLAPPFAVAMPNLETLIIKDCKLRCLPSGLASNRRHVLRVLALSRLSNLSRLENLHSVVELDVFDCPELKSIIGLSRLLTVKVVRCPNLEVLEDVPALDSLVLVDTTAETLPGYLALVKPRYLRLRCNKKLYDSIISGKTSECDKISHIETRECFPPQS